MTDTAIACALACGSYGWRRRHRRPGPIGWERFGVLLHAWRWARRADRRLVLIIGYHDGPQRVEQIAITRRR